MISSSSLLSTCVFTTGFWLSLTAVYPSVAHLTPSSPAPIAQAHSNADRPRADRLTGTWRWHSPDDAAMYITFDGIDRVIFRVEQAGDLQVLSELLYRVDLEADPWRLDLILTSGQAIETIFRFEDSKDQLELELSQLQPGQPRPLAFSDAVLQFDRLAAAPPLPEGMTVVPYEVEQRQQQQGLAQSQLRLIAQAQAIYHREEGQFSEDWQDFVLGVAAETETYRYEVEVLTAAQVAITAEAKTENLSSYSSLLVLFEPEPEQSSLVWHLCATSEPSQDAPSPPQLLKSALGETDARPSPPTPASTTQASSTDPEMQLVCPQGTLPIDF